MSCLQSPLTKVGYVSEELIDGPGPGKGPGLVVVVLDVCADGLFQFTSTAMGATQDLLFCEASKPTLHQVDPGCAGGREMQLAFDAEKGSYGTDNEANQFLSRSYRAPCTVPSTV